MKMTLGEIWEAREALERVLATPMEFRAAYRMRRLAGRIAAEIRDIEAARVRLVEQHADEQTEEEKKTSSHHVASRLTEFLADFGKLLAEEIDLEAEPIPLECLESVTLSPLDLVRIEKFVVPADSGATAGGAATAILGRGSNG